MLRCVGSVAQRVSCVAAFVVSIAGCAAENDGNELAELRSPQSSGGGSNFGGPVCPGYTFDCSPVPQQGRAPSTNTMTDLYFQLYDDDLATHLYQTWVEGYDVAQVDVSFEQLKIGGAQRRAVTFHSSQVWMSGSWVVGQKPAGEVCKQLLGDGQVGTIKISAMVAAYNRNSVDIPLAPQTPSGNERLPILCQADP